jgi:hypothetical protein
VTRQKIGPAERDVDVVITASGDLDVFCTSDRFVLGAYVSERAKDWLPER